MPDAITLLKWRTIVSETYSSLHLSGLGKEERELVERHLHVFGNALCAFILEQEQKEADPTRTT